MLYLKYMNKNNDFSNITLEQVAGMVANGFEQTATKDDLNMLQNDFEALRKETQAGFAYIISRSINTWVRCGSRRMSLRGG